MDAWVIWLIVAILFAVGEIATTSFYLAPFSIGALGGAVVSLIGGEQFFAMAAAMGLTAIAFLFIRPVARRHLTQPARTRTGTDRLIGTDAIVVHRITPGATAGVIRLDGEDWSARAYEDQRTFEPGATVQVVEIRGATAMVAD